MASAGNFLRSLEGQSARLARKAQAAQNRKARELRDAVVSLTPKRTGATAAAWELEEAGSPGDVAHVRNAKAHIGRLNREHRIVDLAVDQVKG